ncbi:MAG: hypothetical protein GF398_13275 [Chitinivibrionales bacterium]|nr:hypothetical protein [Chitinivibrionales bacterium]
MTSTCEGGASIIHSATISQSRYSFAAMNRKCLMIIGYYTLPGCSYSPSDYSSDVIAGIRG